MASPPLALAQSPPRKSPAVSATRRNPHCWSELPRDLMQMVFERLGFTDFERAKSVCSSWQSGSRQSQPNNEIPWMILFPENKNYCLLINPEDKEKVYKTQHLGDDFGKSVCCKTYRSWLLMMETFYRDRADHVYILNIFTHERINLPTSKSIFNPRILWIDEKTKDYLVIGIVDDEKVISVKKGDNSWKETLLFPGIERWNMGLKEEIPQLLYKDGKLYCLNFNKLHIFDFSGDIPLLVFRTCVKECVKRQLVYRIRIPYDDDVHRRNYMVVTLGGDILIVRRKLPRRSKTWTFKVYKMDSDSSEGNKWEEILTLGDESILLDLGITVLAKDLEGITSNSIYYSEEPDGDLHYDNVLSIYNLHTKRVEQAQQFVSSSDPFSYACWFLPCFKRG